jgi:hypothetical protein
MHLDYNYIVILLYREVNGNCKGIHDPLIN